MQVTIDIPDELYQKLTVEGQKQGATAEELLVRYLEDAEPERSLSEEGGGIRIQKNGLPLITAGENSPMALITKHFTNLNDAAFMSDEEFEEMYEQAKAMEAASKRNAA